MIHLLKKLTVFSLITICFLGNAYVESQSIGNSQIKFSIMGEAFASCSTEGEQDDDCADVETIEVFGQEFETDYDDEDELDLEWDDIYEAYVEDEYLQSDEIEAMEEYSDCMKQAYTASTTCVADKTQWVSDWYSDCNSNIRNVSTLVAFMSVYVAGGINIGFGELCDDYRDWGNTNIL